MAILATLEQAIASSSPTKISNAREALIRVPSKSGSSRTDEVGSTSKPSAALRGQALEDFGSEAISARTAGSSTPSRSRPTAHNQRQPGSSRASTLMSRSPVLTVAPTSIDRLASSGIPASG